jgi:hypothetical protein
LRGKGQSGRFVSRSIPTTSSPGGLPTAGSIVTGCPSGSVNVWSPSLTERRVMSRSQSRCIGSNYPLSVRKRRLSQLRSWCALSSRRSAPKNVRRSTNGVCFLMTRVIRTTLGLAGEELLWSASKRSTAIHEQVTMPYLMMPAWAAIAVGFD